MQAQDRHCPAWKPFERTGQDEVEGATAEPDRLPPNEELRCVGGTCRMGARLVLPGAS